MAVFETEEERAAREAEEARARFLAARAAPPPPPRDLLAPPPRDEGPSGDSPAAKLFRQRSAQIAPSSAAAQGADPNPIRFNNELNRPGPARPSAPRDLLAPPREEAPARAAAPVPAPKRDILSPPDPDGDLDRQIEAARDRVITWKPSFFGGAVGAYDRKKYEQAQQALNQLEERRAHRQRQKAASTKEEKPYEVDGALGFRGPDGSLRWERPPARDKPEKEPPAPSNIGEFTTKNGKRVFAMRDHTGKITYEEAPFDVQAPRDPDAEYSRRETDREKRDREREDAREKRDTANRTADERARALAAARREWVDVDNDENIPTHAAREAKKRRIASYYGVQYPPAPQAQPAAAPQAAAPAPASSHGAPPAAGGPIRFVRDPKTGALVRAR